MLMPVQGPREYVSTRMAIFVLGYSLTSVMGAIPAESFGGRNFGSIFGTVMLAAIIGGAAGPWVAGTLHDITGSYSLAFWLSIVCSVFSAISVWRAAPRRSYGIPTEGGGYNRPD